MPPAVHAGEFPLEFEDLFAEEVEEEVGIDDLVEKLFFAVAVTFARAERGTLGPRSAMKRQLVFHSCRFYRTTLLQSAVLCVAVRL